MVLLTVILTLVIYSIDFLEMVYIVGLFKNLHSFPKPNHLSSFLNIGGLRECFPQIRSCAYYKYTCHLVEHVIAW